MCVWGGGGRELVLKRENRRASYSFGTIQDIDYSGRHANLIKFYGTEYLQTWKIQIRLVDQC